MGSTTTARTSVTTSEWEAPIAQDGESMLDCGMDVDRQKAEKKKRTGSRTAGSEAEKKGGVGRLMQKQDQKQNPSR